MKLCGLTGGIGMGKSTTAEMLDTLAVPVVDTDDLARQLVRPGEPALVEISAAFGGNIIAQPFAPPGLHKSKSGVLEVIRWPWLSFRCFLKLMRNPILIRLFVWLVLL
jgi:hypothetical protein